MFVKIYIKMHFKSVSSCLVISLKEAGWAHLKPKLLAVITKVSGGKVSQRQLLHSLSLNFQDSSIWNRWSRLREEGKKGGGRRDRERERERGGGVERGKVV